MRYKTKQRIVYTVLGLFLTFTVGVGVGYNRAMDEAFDCIATCEQQGGAPLLLNHRINCVY